MSTDKRTRFPQVCSNCRQEAVSPAVVQEDVSVKYDGERHILHDVSLPVLRCENCGEIIENNETEAAIDHALRKQLNLLSPNEIREIRFALLLTQEQLAKNIGVTAENLSRWETGTTIQSKFYNNLLRAYRERHAK